MCPGFTILISRLIGASYACVLCMLFLVFLVFLSVYKCFLPLNSEFVIVCTSDMATPQLVAPQMTRSESLFFAQSERETSLGARQI
jgi:hypothetical protein